MKMHSEEGPYARLFTNWGIGKIVHKLKGGLSK